MKRLTLPETDSIEKLAQFWDAHDLTDFDRQLEEIKRPLFVRARGTSVQIELPAREAGRVKRIARSRGVDESTMIRQWILERIHGSFVAVQADNGKPKPRKRKPHPQ